MRLKTISCPLCRSSNFVEVYRRKLDWLNYEYVNVVCKECGFIYRNPSMDYDDYLEFYENGGLLSSNQFINYDESSRSNIVRDLRTKFIFENLSIKSGKIMDIGGGNGFLLENFNPDSWERYLLEPGPLTDDVSSDIHVFKGGIEDFYYSSTFDLISMMSVLEHLQNPRSAIKKIHKLLTNDGYLVIEVPNSLNPSIKISDFYSFEHISGFTLETIEYLLNCEGFQIIKTNFYKLIPDIHKIAKKSAKTNPKKPKNAYREIFNVFQEYKAQKHEFQNRIYEQIKIVFDKTLKGKVTIFGAGEHTMQLLQLFKFMENVSCFLDSDPKKQGKIFLNKPILNPGDLKILEYI